MKLTKDDRLFGAGRWIRLGLGMCLMGMVLGRAADAQAVSTTTVQGTVYLANGQAGAGTLDVSWPAFTTANNQAIAAGRASVTIAPDGFMTVNLAPNLGATPAGLYYTAVYHMSDGATSTEYWVVPAAAQASLGQVRAQLMPAAQAVQAVSKAYVDQAITELTQSLLTASGGTLSGPLYLNGDPTQPLQAADKHYVDTTFSLEVPIAGGGMTGPLTAPAVNGVQSPAAGSTQTTLQAAISAAGTNGAMEIPPTYAGSDGFTNPNGVRVMDLRPAGAQQTERGVKEFGAVCDGVTDDTNALQAALNFAQAHSVALTIPQGTCKTQALNWHGESIGGMGKQVSALMGFPGQDVLATVTDSANLLANTRIHDLTIYVDQSVDVSCSPAEGRAPAGSCALGRLLEKNSIFSAGGNGLTGTAGTGAGWAVGNCAIAMPAATGAGGNGLRVAEIENVVIAATGADPMAAQYPGAHSTHACGLYLAQWPQWSEFRNIDIRGVNTGIAIPALPVAAPAGLNADSNRWQNITIQATHGFTAAAGSNNVLDNIVVMAGNSAATAEPPTGLVLDFAGAQQGWTVRNAVVLPSWNAVQPQLALTASGGAVTGVTAGPEHGLGFDPYGTQVPLKFSGSCTAAASANVNNDGSIGTISVTQGGVGCSGTTTASVNVAGTWDTSAPVNLIAGQSMSFFGGNLLKGNGGYTVWNATGSQSYETQLDGGGGTLRGGGSYAGLVANSQLGAVNPVDQFPGADFGAKLQACLNTLSASYGGTCDARNFTGTQSMGSNLTISTANVTVLLPCATISTANQVIVTAGTRNVALRGCALRGASAASGSQGGTVFLYSGAGAMVQVGDPTYAADTMGFHLDNVVINTTAASSATAQGLTAYRTQEMDLESLYFLGNQNQMGMTLDGTGNYTGGTFFDNAFNGFQTAVNAIGHQIANPATTDWMNASTFVRLHIDCPASGGSPIAGTYGINLLQGDGNTFTGGDVEGCSTALHLGPNAQNNTIVGLRNENSASQVVADAGSAYNNWMTGGTMFTGQLTDSGTRNSFLDTFHRSFNSLNGDWYGSQKDATLTNHYRLGIGAGNERGLLDRYETDYGYRWTTGLSDAAAGEQFYQVFDELNNVYRLSIGQYNNGQSSANNQTVINAAGTGAIVLNGSTNSGTGGIVIGSGGASESTVATINNAGNAQFNGTLQVGGASTFTGTTTVKNQADAEIDATLWAGLTASQKESFIYKDWNGNSQWYMVKDAGNNWALNSATGGLDSFKAYQSTNSGDTYINASNTSGVVRVNYESGSGTGFNIYGGGSSTLYASFTGTTAIKFPGLAASSGHNCLQIDNSGWITNTGSACGSGGSGGGSGTVNSGTAGQFPYYAASGTTLSSLSPSAALANLGGAPAFTLTTTGTSGPATYTGNVINIPQYSGSGSFLSLSGGTMSNNAAIAFQGTGASTTLANLGVGGVSALNSGAKGDGVTDDTGALNAGFSAALAANQAFYLPTPSVCYKVTSSLLFGGFGGTVQIVGDGKGQPNAGTASPICYTSAIGSTSPVIDAVMHGRLIINGISIVPLSGTPSAGTCVLSKPDTTGGGEVSIYNSFMNCGGGAGTSAAAIIGQDLSSVISSQLQSHGNALVLGQVAGPSTTTSHYTTGAGYGDTHLLVGGSILLSTLSPLELTGICGDVVVDNSGGAGYIAEVNGGDSTHAIVDLSYATTCQGTTLTLSGVNIENQSSSTPFAAIATVNSTNTGPSGVFVNGGVWTGRILGGSVTLAGNFQGVHIVGINGSSTAFSDTTQFTNGEYQDTLNLNALSPSAGGSPGFSGNIGGSTITGYNWNPQTIAVQPTNLYNGAYRICESSYGNGICYTNSGSAYPGLNVLSSVNAGILSAATVNTTSASVSGLTGYVYANSSSAETASTTIPGSAVSGNIGGNAATATALATTPTLCPTGQAPTGILASGNATGCASINSMAYPGAGIIVSTGNSWGTSLTAPASAIVGVSDTQTITNKSINGSEINSGTLPHAQLPTLLSGDIPNNAANTSGTAAGLSGTPNLPTGTTVNSTPATGDNSTKVQTTAGTLAQIAANAMNPNTPAWLQYLGTGADGSNTNASGSIAGEKYYTNFTVPYGNTVTCGAGWGYNASLIVHATGTCTIAGTINCDAEGTTGNATGGNFGGGGGGGSSSGSHSQGFMLTPGGTGNSSGGASNGGNAPTSTSITANSQRALVNGAFLGTDGLNAGGSAGGDGGNNTGSGGVGGGGVILDCGSIVGTDGTYTGTISASGGPGLPPTGNSQGGGGGGGGGVVVLSSQKTVSTWPNIYAAGGPGGLVTVPYATWTRGSCTSPPKATLAVSGGAISGTCTVVQAGAGCGTGAGTVLQVLGGGGTLGTGTVTPTWSGGTLASCTATAGTSSGYTAATYTTAGTGGDGGPGWVAEFSGW